MGSLRCGGRTRGDFVIQQNGLPALRVTRKKAGSFVRGGVALYAGDVADLYDLWPSPVVIISDGPYGVGGFPGDPPTAKALDRWYEPHIAAWSKRTTPETPLWFWGTEIGWATVHPCLEKHGWAYRNCHVWDKGIAHVAGNSNTQRLRKLPGVTEVCVQYVTEARFAVNGSVLSMQEWLRYEWERSGIPLYRANEACGVKNAATRKYLTKCHLWYYPPVSAFERMVRYLNAHAKPEGRPYFSRNGKKPISAQEWERMRAKFKCEIGVTNVWREPAVRGSERVKRRYRCVHANQKPLRLIELIIRLSSSPGDVVWEPFGGLCTGAVASHKLQRRCYSAEILPEFFGLAVRRLRTYDDS